MRIRSIRPEFWSSEDIAALDWHTRLVYIGLWSYVDDNGVGRDNERLIVADLFPLDEDFPEASRRVTGALRDLSTGGQITRYEVSGKPFLHIAAWSKHQRIEKASKGRYPLPTSDDAEFPEPSPTAPGALPDMSTPGEGEKGRRGEGEKGRKKPARALPADWAPTEAHQSYGKENGLDVTHEAEQFRLHATANGRTAVEWNAAFSMWLRKSFPSKTPQPAAAHGGGFWDSGPR